ncbi:hypothetical protein CGCTS75_v008484 [Colletotrichum tropicale]|nr:hypothetical protein CGCTS75_v008484 [Colletotrichum tropicale]
MNAGTTEYSKSDDTLSEDTARTIGDVLNLGYENYNNGFPAVPPRFVALGTLGVDSAFWATSNPTAIKLRLSCRWFYNDFFHKDLYGMEKYVAIQLGELCRNTLVVRPGFLTDDDPKVFIVHIGTVMSPPSGFTISRKTLGEWLFRHGVFGNLQGIISITGS